MFTIEHDFDATVVTLIDDPAGYRQEDITITAFEDCVVIEQSEREGLVMPRRCRTILILRQGPETQEIYLRIPSLLSDQGVPRSR